VSLLVPRAQLAPLLATPAAVSASVLSRDTFAGRLVAGQLLALRQDSVRAGGGAAVDGLARLVAGAVGTAGDAEAGVARAAREALLASIKRHIEAELNAPSLSAAALCRRFGTRAHNSIGFLNRTAGSSATCRSGGFAAPSVCSRHRPAARRA
jgi:hypothetical protein